MLEAALEFWGMESLNAVPTKRVPPPERQNMSKTRKVAYFDKHIGDFVDEFVMADPDKEVIQQQKLLNERTDLVTVINQDHDYVMQTPEPHEPDHDLLDENNGTRSVFMQSLKHLYEY